MVNRVRRFGSLLHPCFRTRAFIQAFTCRLPLRSWLAMPCCGRLWLTPSRRRKLAGGNWRKRSAFLIYCSGLTTPILYPYRVIAVLVQIRIPLKRLEEGGEWKMDDPMTRKEWRRLVNKALTVVYGRVTGKRQPTGYKAARSLGSDFVHTAMQAVRFDGLVACEVEDGEDKFYHTVSSLSCRSIHALTCFTSFCRLVTV